TEQMARVTRKELTWRVLMGRDRSKYRGEIVHVEGWLRRLVWIGSNKSLESQGIKNLYEAWIFPPDSHDEPICVVLSELPSGMETVENNQKFVRVAVDGYFFKRYKYRAVKDTKLTPLVIGHTLTVPSVAPDPGAEAFERLFLPTLLSMVFAMVVCAFIAQRWFRSGDRRAHDHFQRSREAEWVPPTDPDSRSGYPDASMN